MCPCNIISKWQFSRSKNYYMIFNFLSYLLTLSYYLLYYFYVVSTLIINLSWNDKIDHPTIFFTQYYFPYDMWPLSLFCPCIIDPICFESEISVPSFPSNFFDNVWACEVNTPAPARQILTVLINCFDNRFIFWTSHITMNFSFQLFFIVGHTTYIKSGGQTHLLTIPLGLKN